MQLKLFELGLVGRAGRWRAGHGFQTARAERDQSGRLLAGVTARADDPSMIFWNLAAMGWLSSTQRAAVGSGIVLNLPTCLTRDDSLPAPFFGMSANDSAGVARPPGVTLGTQFGGTHFTFTPIRKPCLKNRGPTSKTTRDDPNEAVGAKSPM